MAGFLCQRCLSEECSCVKTNLRPQHKPDITPREDYLSAMDTDSGTKFLELLDVIAQEDSAGLREAYKSYGPSWKSRGGVGAFMMLARKWDRMHNRLQQLLRSWDIFYGIATDDRGEGLIDDVRDLRRYLMLVEAEMRARGFKRGHRDNNPLDTTERSKPEFQ